jgi:hypothetical protein
MRLLDALTEARLLPAIMRASSIVLMDVRDKFPGYTHIALRVASIPETIAALNENGIPITGTSQLWRRRAEFGVRARP